MGHKFNWHYSKEHNIGAYEEMVNGESIITIDFITDSISLPISAWRELNEAWNQKKWDEKFDTLDVVDECFEKEKRE